MVQSWCYEPKWTQTQTPYRRIQLDAALFPGHLCQKKTHFQTVYLIWLLPKFPKLFIQFPHFLQSGITFLSFSIRPIRINCHRNRQPWFSKVSHKKSKLRTCADRYRTINWAVGSSLSRRQQRNRWPLAWMEDNVLRVCNGGRTSKATSKVKEN